MYLLNENTIINGDYRTLLLITQKRGIVQLFQESIIR